MGPKFGGSLGRGEVCTRRNRVKKQPTALAVVSWCLGRDRDLRHPRNLEVPWPKGRMPAVGCLRVIVRRAHSLAPKIRLLTIIRRVPGERPCLVSLSTTWGRLISPSIRAPQPDTMTRQAAPQRRVEDVRRAAEAKAAEETGHIVEAKGCRGGTPCR